MKPRPTIRDVARRAGVSLGTVSNVLNRPERVSAESRERVRAAIEALAFTPSTPARSLRTGGSGAIGLVVLDIANPFFADLVRGAEDAARAAGLVLMVSSSDEEPGRESDCLDLFGRQRVRGVVITPASDVEPQLDSLRADGIPAVRIDSRAHDGECSLTTDELAGARMAVTHLLERGHRTIGFVGGSLWPVARRRTGALQAMAAAGLGSECLIDIPVEHHTFMAGRDAGERLLGLSPRPSAVLCVNDLIAIGVLQVMTEHGVRVPDELAIVGYDDIDFAAAAAVPLTSVRQPRRLLGRTAVEMVLSEAAEGEAHVHEHRAFLPELVVRGSTRGRDGSGGGQVR